MGTNGHDLMSDEEAKLLEGMIETAKLLAAEMDALDDDENDPALLWHGALFQLVYVNNPAKVIKLLRNHIPPPPEYCEQLADLFDPSRAKTGPVHLKVERSGHFVRSMRKRFRFEVVADRVREAMAAVGKKDAAVAMVAAEVGVTERYVWKALEFADAAKEESTERKSTTSVQ